MTELKPALPKLLLDEHIWVGLAAALRERGFDVIHVSEVQRDGLSDDDQLEYAAVQDRAILTFNARHFEPLAAQWFFAQKAHAGIIISDELPLSELLRRTERLLTSRSAQDLRNLVHWLQAYK